MRQPSLVHNRMKAPLTITAGLEATAGLALIAAQFAPMSILVNSPLESSVARVVVIADHFAFMNRSPRKPPIYIAASRAAICFLASLAAGYREHIIHFWRKTGSLAEANGRLLEGVVWRHTLSAFRSGFSSSFSCSTRSVNSRAFSGATAS